MMMINDNNALFIMRNK